MNLRVGMIVWLASGNRSATPCTLRRKRYLPSIGHTLWKVRVHLTGLHCMFHECALYLNEADARNRVK